MDYPHEEYYYYKFAKEFGWTIEEVDRQPARIANWLIAIADLETEVLNERQSS